MAMDLATEALNSASPFGLVMVMYAAPILAIEGLVRAHWPVIFGLLEAAPDAAVPAAATDAASTDAIVCRPIGRARKEGLGMILTAWNSNIAAA